jgi:hypothetical protein
MEYKFWMNVSHVSYPYSIELIDFNMKVEIIKQSGELRLVTRLQAGQPDCKQRQGIFFSPDGHWDPLSPLSQGLK